MYQSRTEWTAGRADGGNQTNGKSRPVEAKSNPATDWARRVDSEPIRRLPYQENSGALSSLQSFLTVFIQHSTLSRTFIKVMNEYNQEQNLYRSDTGLRILNQMRISEIDVNRGSKDNWESSEKQQQTTKSKKWSNSRKMETYKCSRG